MATDTATQFLARFQEATDGLSHISSGSYIQGCHACPPDADYENGIADAPSHFSWSYCDTCNSRLGGDRETGHAFYKHGAGEKMCHLHMCVDCVAYVANSTLPEGDDAEA